MKNLLAFLLVLFFSGYWLNVDAQPHYNKSIRVGAERLAVYLPHLENKNIAIVANQTSMVGNTHLVDTLLQLGVGIKKVFAPEHGFRGGADAGEHVANEKDVKTGLPIVSLYGKNKKPKPEWLKNIDVVVFDIQDVGVRYYTYISTMHYVMEACAENHIRLLVLDRPNPNGFYVDGPILQEDKKSFVGMHKIPLVHGLTIGELAGMINGELWLEGGLQCDVVVIECLNYSHQDFYELAIAPSPNLPNMASVYLYPSLGLFEGTEVSIGRGTDFPFQVIGLPKVDNPNFSFEFTPMSRLGAKYPKHEGMLCKGFDLRAFGMDQMYQIKGLYLYWLKAMYLASTEKHTFFIENNFFNLLAGNTALMQQIIEGKSMQEIKQTWQEDLALYNLMRKKYLLYPDF